MTADWVDQIHDYVWPDDDGPDPADLVELEADELREVERDCAEQYAREIGADYPIPPDPWVQ